MKVRYIGKNSDPLYFIRGREYEKLGEEHGLWRVVDETEEDYLYPPSWFEAIEKGDEGPSELL